MLILELKSRKNIWNKPSQRRTAEGLRGRFRQTVAADTAPYAQPRRTRMPLLDLFWTILWAALFVIWLFLLFTVFVDIFRSGMSGWAKALWVVFVIILPFLGVLVYLIAHGDDLRYRLSRQRTVEATAEEARQVYLTGRADELTKLKKLHDDGVLTDEEYAAQKERLLAD
jgi:ABC-type Fe3+ transport system permease subunit